MLFRSKQKTAYEITYGDWSSDVCSSDLDALPISITVTVSFALALALIALDDCWLLLLSALPSGFSLRPPGSFRPPSLSAGRLLSWFRSSFRSVSRRSLFRSSSSLATVPAVVVARIELFECWSARSGRRSAASQNFSNRREDTNTRTRKKN